MKVNGVIAIVLILASMACSHNPHKAEKLDTTIEKSDVISGIEKVGVKNGNMIIQKKVLMAEELRNLQNSVYELEDHVYGNRKYGSYGLYGVLRNCRVDLSDKQNGGDGRLLWTEPLDRITDKEEELNVGLDESNKIVGLSEEFLKDRLQRFQSYKQILHKRQDELGEKVSICETTLKSKKYDQQKSELEARYPTGK